MIKSIKSAIKRRKVYHAYTQGINVEHVIKFLNKFDSSQRVVITRNGGYYGLTVLSDKSDLIKVNGKGTPSDPLKTEAIGFLTLYKA